VYRAPMISLSTKKIKGPRENDFIMASMIDRLLDRGWDHKL
jgi:pterin-4a-carbinolamine dehydratase